MKAAIEKIADKLPFGPKRVFIVFLLSFLFWFIAAIIFTALVGAWIRPCGKEYLKLLMRQPQFLSIYLLLYYSIAVGLTWFVLIDKIKEKLESFFNKKNFKEDLIYGFELFVKSLGILILFFICLIAFFAIISKIFGLDYTLIKNTYLHGKEVEVQQLYAAYKLNPLIIFLVVIFGPFYEEIFYRGCLYSTLRKKCSVNKSILISSLFFALIHGYVFNFLPVLILGIILSYAYEKRASLTAPLLVHFGWNAFSMIFAFLKI